MSVFRLDFTGCGSADINLGGMKQTVYHTTAKTKKDALRKVLFKHLRPTANALYTKLLPYVNDIVTEVPSLGQRIIDKKRQIDLFGGRAMRLSSRDRVVISSVDDEAIGYFAIDRDGDWHYIECPKDGNERLQVTEERTFICQECGTHWKIPLEDGLNMYYASEDVWSNSKDKNPERYVYRLRDDVNVLLICPKCRKDTIKSGKCSEEEKIHNFKCKECKTEFVLPMNKIPYYYDKKAMWRDYNEKKNTDSHGHGQYIELVEE